jgi:glycosyltransferase involved in cell wall biosynthesis
MKKLLIISYLFNQDKAVGAVRIRGLVKYLPSFGWDCVILTVHGYTDSSLSGKVITTAERDTITAWKSRLGFNLKKPIREQFGVNVYKEKNIFVDFFINVVKEVFAYPDIHKGWYSHAVQDGEKIMEHQKFDAILSSSGPETSHLVAHELKDTFGIPWVADFRDLWTQNHYHSYSFIRKFFEKRLEVSTISSADALVIVSPVMANELKTLHTQKKVFFIPNGYDNDSVNPAEPLPSIFTITYTGQLYKGRRDPELLFRAIHELASEDLIDLKDFAVHFYGWMESWLDEDIIAYHLEDVVKIHGLVSREESIHLQRQSHLLLLLTWDNPEERGVYTGKIFDYLAARRPILSVGISGGVIDELLDTTNAGVHGAGKDKIKGEIRKFYDEFKRSGSVEYRGIEREIQKFSHKEMAKQFAVVLDQIT